MPNPDNSCLCFTRKFQGLDNEAAQSNFAAAQRYIELKQQHNQVKTEYKVTAFSLMHAVKP